MNIGFVFEYNRTQTVLLPAETHFSRDIKKVSVRVVGNSRIIEPLNQSWDSFFHPQEEGVTDDFMNERADPIQQDRESF